MIQTFGGTGWAYMTDDDDDNHGRNDDSQGGGSSNGNGDHTQPGENQPLYKFVRDKLVERIQSGTWKPGQVIPNEHEIAREFGVSHGTARRALIILADFGFLTRRQGSGTWVQDDSPAARYRYFAFFDDKGARITPDSRDIAATLARANSRERSNLNLGDKARVIRMTRTRTRNGKPFIAEALSVPETLFPSLADEPQLPDALYDFYQKAHKVLIMGTTDRITVAAADVPIAAQLRVKVGTPLLKIDRIAYTLHDKPVEWRVWLCHLKNAHYLAHM